jgi:hypothetical protein
MGSLIELEEFVGQDWVRTYQGELTAEVLSDAIAWATTPRPTPAPLEHYSWDVCGKDTAEFFRSILDNHPEN